jgi:signal transduction histidine kinase
MDKISIFKRMVCLLSCQPRDMQTQLPGSLSCLKDAIEVQAVGILWLAPDGEFISLGTCPEEYPVENQILYSITHVADPFKPAWGQTTAAWLSVPMKVGGDPLGRLWAVDHSERVFSQDEREFIMMVGNQLALALENSHLYDEVQRLAVKRGELLRRVIATQDERCRRISRELHDEISQSLTAMALDIEAVQVADRLTKDLALRRLSDMRPRLQTALEEVNRIILDLRPTLLEDMGLLTALRWFASQRLEPIGVQIHLIDDNLEPPEPHIETTLYRIAQEALNNVAKHAKATQVWLNMACKNGDFVLTVRDDGIGFDPVSVLNNPDNRIGIGLFGMQERAALVGGTVEIQSGLGSGTTLIVKIPVKTEYYNDTYQSIVGG